MDTTGTHKNREAGLRARLDNLSSMKRGGQGRPRPPIMAICLRYNESHTMKAIVLKQIGTVRLEDVPEPRIEQADDAIVRVTTAGVCGSDLHIVQGRDPGIRMDTIMGHEFVGVIKEAGPNVTGFREGDRVVAPFTATAAYCLLLY